MKRLLFLFAGLAIAATPPSVTERPKLSDRQISNFWRAKAAKAEADGAFNAIAAELYRTCGHEAVYNPATGDPWCGPETPTLPPAEK